MLVCTKVGSSLQGARILSLLLSLRKLSILSTLGGEFLLFLFLLNLSMFSPNTSPVLRAEIRSSNSAVWSLLLQEIFVNTNTYFLDLIHLPWMSIV